MRIDKYLSQLDLFPRRRSGSLLRKGVFSVNGEQIISPKHLLAEGDILSRDDKQVIVKFRVTVVLNKPVGYISSDVDERRHLSYKHLLKDYPYVSMLHIAGRLDVDTHGLILATSDGILLHRIISPKQHLPKTYRVIAKHVLSDAQLDALRVWVTLGDGYMTLPAGVERVWSHEILLTLTEGKYHQVKRMLHAVDNEVLELQRTAIWPWRLDDLRDWEIRELTREEVDLALDIKITI